MKKLNLGGGREICPKCNRKGLGFAPHPHAFGWKDYGRAKCRYCNSFFSVAKLEAALKDSKEN